MLKRFTVGSVFGVEIDIDVTLALAVPLLTGLIAAQIAQLTTLLSDVFGTSFGAGLQSGPWPWILGLLVAIGLFCSIALHELGHVFVAESLGYEVESVTLWILGGIAESLETPSTWWHEVVIALAGPAVSVALAGGFTAALFVTPPGLDVLGFVLAYLGLLNVVLAVFNMLPGFPMDGGRVLRGLLLRTRSMNSATALAARVGQFVALLMGIVGVVSLNIFLLAIAFFVYIGAGAEAARVRYESVFEDMTVSDVMTPADDVEWVTPEAAVDDLYDRMYETHHIGYPVLDDGELAGIVTLSDVSSVPSDRADEVSVREVMTADVVSVAPDLSAADAFEQMQSKSVDRMPVVRDGEFVGLVSQTDLMRVLRISQEAEATAPAAVGSAGQSHLGST